MLDLHSAMRYVASCRRSACASLPFVVPLPVCPSYRAVLIPTTPYRQQPSVPLLFRLPSKHLPSTCTHRPRTLPTARADSLPPLVSSTTWRLPRWYVQSLQARYLNPQSENSPSPSAAPPVTSQKYETASWLFLFLLIRDELFRVARAVPKRRTVGRLLASAFVLLCASLSWRGYAALNDIVSDAVSAVTEEHVSRPTEVGRLCRVVLFPVPALHFSRSSVAVAPAGSTAPDVSAREVVVHVYGIASALRRRTPLALNVTFVQPVVTVKQAVSLGPDGKLVAKWDPGIGKGDMFFSGDDSEAPRHGSARDKDSEDQGQREQVVDIARMSKDDREGSMLPFTQEDIHELSLMASQNKHRPSKANDVAWSPIHHARGNKVPLVSGNNANRAYCQCRGAQAAAAELTSNIKVDMVPGSAEGVAPAVRASVMSSAPKVVLRKISIRNGTVRLQPGDLGVYGQGPELVEVRNVFGAVTLSASSSVRSGEVSSNLVGNVAEVFLRGMPVGGGSIAVTGQCDLCKLSRLQSGDDVAHVAVKGSGIQAKSIAAFLNLPFRADEGSVDGDVNMAFYYDVPSQVPDIHGIAYLRDVSLRFHPDPKTPEFKGISGGMRFDEKVLFMDGPKGNLGTLPMTVVGSVDMDGEYDMLAYVRSTDVNNIIDTFDIDKFVPVCGQVKGEARMTGVLEEPYIEGWAVSAGQCIFDRTPVDRAAVSFGWDAVAGVINFTDIRADVCGGGEVQGSGGMYFDMTKVTPFDMHRPMHHPNNPKALHFNPGSGNAEPLPCIPSDELGVDLSAPSRPYDSMRFDFSAQGLCGGDLLAAYGGKYGELASTSTGYVNGEAIIAGHAKDANMRVFWRTVSAPPKVLFSNYENSEDSAPGKSSGNESSSLDPRDLTTGDDGAANVRRDELPVEHYQRHQSTRGFALGMPGTSKVPASQRYESVPKDASFPGSDGLGNGDFQGVVFMKLGDLPGARRVKVRTTVSNFDARRLVWTDPALKPFIANTPYMKVSLDSYFKGVLNQKVVPIDNRPRTPRNELLGAEGSLAVRNLRLNKTEFENAMTGLFRFSKNDFELSLDGRKTEVLRTDDSKSNVLMRSDRKAGSFSNSRVPDHVDQPEGSGVPESKSSPTKDTLQARGSATKGTAFMHLRQGKTEVVASLHGASPVEQRQDVSGWPLDDERAKLRCARCLSYGYDFCPADHRSLEQNSSAQGTQVVSLSVRNLNLDEILGGNGRGTNGVPTAIVNGESALNLKVREGSGTIMLRRARLGVFGVDKFFGHFLWQKDVLHLRKAVAKVRKSEYYLQGSYALPKEYDAWEMNVSLGRGDLRDIVAWIDDTLQGWNSQAITGGSRVIPPRYPAAFGKDPFWTHLSGLVGHDVQRPGQEDTWSVPNLPPNETLAWFREFRKNEERREQFEASANLPKLLRPGQVAMRFGTEPIPTIRDLSGRAQGSISIRYGSKVGTESWGGSKGVRNKSDSALDVLRKTSIAFDLRGDDWRIGSQALGKVEASGSFAKNRLEIFPSTITGPDGFAMSSAGHITLNGEVGGYAYFENASAQTLSRYIRGNLRARGNCNVRLDVSGVISDPKLDCRASWRNAKLNGQKVRDAQGGLTCRDGRCSLDLNARVGGRDRPDSADELDVRTSLHERRSNSRAGRKSTNPLLQPGAVSKRFAFLPGRSAIPKKAESRALGEQFRLQISAPVGEHVLRRMRRSIPPEIWDDLQGVLVNGVVNTDDRISMDIKVRKYGLVLANAAFPSLGWMDGSSSVDMRVRGTLREPVVAGNASVSDGQLWPDAISAPIGNVRGEVTFDESGFVRVHSLYGKFNGKGIGIDGSLPLSPQHRKLLTERATVPAVADRSLSRAQKRTVAEQKSAAASALDHITRGITVDAKDILVDLKDQFSGHVTGRVAIKGAVTAPCLTGHVTLSRGTVYLSSPTISPDAARAVLPPAIRGAIKAGTVKADKGAGAEPPGRQDRPAGGPDATPKTRPLLRQLGARYGRHADDIAAREGDRMDAVVAAAQGGTRYAEIDGKDMSRCGDGADVSEPEASVGLDGLRLSLGKGLDIVYPYVMKFGVSGNVWLRGTTLKPIPAGKVKFTSGVVNLLTSKLELVRSAENYASFTPRIDGGDVMDPLVSVSLEDGQMIVQVKEARASQWAQRMSIVDKRGEQMEEGAWNEFVQNRLDEVERGLAAGVRLPRVVMRYFLDSYSVKGKVKGVQWRVFPAFMSPYQGGDDGEVGEVAVGADFDFGKVMLSYQKGLGRSQAGSVVFRPSHRVKMRLGSDGVRGCGEFEVRLSSRPRRGTPAAGGRRGGPPRGSAGGERERDA